MFSEPKISRNHITYVEVIPHPLRVRALRNNRRTPLDPPAQHHRPLTNPILLRNTLHPRIPTRNKTRDPQLCSPRFIFLVRSRRCPQRRIRHEFDAFGVAEGFEVALWEMWVHFDLVDGGDDGKVGRGEEGGECGDGEVGDSDGAEVGGVGGEEALH